MPLERVLGPLLNTLLHQASRQEALGADVGLSFKVLSGNCVWLGAACSVDTAHSWFPGSLLPPF